MAVQLEILKLELAPYIEGEVTDEIATAAEDAVETQIEDWDSVPSLIQHALILLESEDALTAEEVAAVDDSDWDTLKTELDARTSMDAGFIAYLKQRISLITDNLSDNTIVVHN